MQDLSRVLNIIGVVLNLFSGLMLSPEAIGLDRIRKFERKIELASKGVLGAINNAYEFLDRVRQVMKVNPLNPREMILSMLICVPLELVLFFYRHIVFSWVRDIFLCLFNPSYATFAC